MKENKSHIEPTVDNAGSQQDDLLQARLDEALMRLAEANDTIEAIRSGEVDALVIRSDDGPKLFTLKGSDEVYRMIIEQMNEGAATLTTDGILLYGNPTLAAMIGLPLEKITGRSLSNFVGEHDPVSFRELMDEAGQRPVKRETVLGISGGAVAPVQLSLKRLMLDDSDIISLIVTDLTYQKQTQRMLSEKNGQLEEAQEIARDLNLNLESTVKERTRDLEISMMQQTEAEKQLRKNQEQLTRILETMAEGVQIIDTSGTLLYANPMAQKILGIRQIEGVGAYIEPSYGHFHLDGRPLAPLEHPLRKVLQTGSAIYDYEIAIKPEDQEKFFISINAAPLKDETGAVIGSVGTFMDVTTRRKVIQQKDEFISVASHELKTPVTSLKAALQLLDDIKDDASRSGAILPKLITSANKSLNKLSVLISDLLNVSKIRGGQFMIQKKPVCIHDLVLDCIETIQQDGSFAIVVDGPQNITVEADEHKIDQVIINFLNNAIKYASTSKEIRIRISDLPEQVRISVIDRGTGISPDKIPHLFDRYFRVDNSGTQYSGLGLGLYICAEIIRKHDGQIGVESVVGEGSEFWFTLPKQSKKS